VLEKEEKEEAMTISNATTSDARWMSWSVEEP
jgi:hypothetical protein